MENAKRVSYKGYSATLTPDRKGARAVCGQIEGISDLAVLSSTPDGAEAAFRETVDGYLEACKECGKEPQKPQAGGKPEPCGISASELAAMLRKPNPISAKKAKAFIRAKRKP